MTVSRVVAVAGFVAVVLAMGCSSNGRFSRGDKLEVRSEVKVSGEARWEDGSLEGFSSFLPPGTLLQVLVAQRPGAVFVECSVEEVAGNRDEEYLIRRVLPPPIANRHGLLGFSVSIQTSQIGQEVVRRKE